MHFAQATEAPATVQDCTGPGDKVTILHLKEACNEEFMCLMFRDLIPKFLIILKELFWCAHCRRGLFPTVCPHPEVF